MKVSARFIQSSDGGLVVNPAISIFDQQDSLLTSWLLSTIISSFLSSFTDVRTAHDVWIVVNNLFVADSSTKQSQLRHELHSIRKGSLFIRAYVNKITSLCALLAASGTQISEAERTVVLLAGLSSNFNAIVSSASLFSRPLLFQRIVDVLLEYEARHGRTAQEVLIAANMVEGPQLQSTDGPFWEEGVHLVVVAVILSIHESSVRFAADMAILRRGATTGTIVTINRRLMLRWFDKVVLRLACLGGMMTE